MGDLANLEGSKPSIELFDHTKGDLVRVEWLTKKAIHALPDCLESVGSEEPVLPQLSSVEVSLIGDEEIARVHGDFMGDPTPTDVITFHHGEILVSVDTAEREGPEHKNSIEEEVLLYLIHGLLHLNGHTDLVEPDREQMHSIQNEILRRVLNRG